MDRLYSVKDICARYQCKSATARKYMRDMEHIENPLMVSERAVAAWERRKGMPPESETRMLMRKGVKKCG
jgi:hypothetical protein